MRKIKKIIKEQKNKRLIRDAIVAWDPVGLSNYALEREYKPEIRDIATAIGKDMNAQEIAGLIADVFTMHLFPYVYETRQCLKPAMEIKIRQDVRKRRNKKMAIAAGCGAAVMVLSLPVLGYLYAKRGDDVWKS